MNNLHSMAVAAADKANSKINWADMGQSAMKVLVTGLIIGAGLPAIYAIGMRLWDEGTGGVHEDGTVTKGKPIALVGAALCFLIVLAAVVCGLLLIMQKTIKHYTGIHIQFPGMSS